MVVFFLDYDLLSFIVTIQSSLIYLLLHIINLHRVNVAGAIPMKSTKNEGSEGDAHKVSQ